MHNSRFFPGLVTCALTLTFSSAHAEFAIRDGDTVAFLGDSITAARTYGKIIENYTLLRFPKRNVRFINVGIGGDTAADGLQRLERDVFQNNVTLLTVAFGINDIGWGMHADDAHRHLFLESIGGIVAACREKGVRVYICSAAITGGDPADGEDSYLQNMCDEAMEIARQRGGQTIDVQRMMREVQTKAWEASTDKSETQKLELLHQPDTIHLNEVGQLAMAWAILKGLGAPAEVSSATLDATSGKVVDASGCRVSNIRPTNLGLEFTRLDERLPFNNGLFYALNYQFVPVPQELNRYMLSVKNLASGQYRLTVAGRDVGRFTAKNLDSGVNISSSTGDPWQPGGPWDAQASVLKSITDARHSAATGIQSSSDWLADSDLAAELSNQASPVNHQLERMQKTIAKPWPYRYVLTGVVDKPGENTDAKIMIESPLEYQVFQRFQKTAGRVVVRGTAEPGAERVQARVRGRAVDGELSGEWRDISFTEDSNRFEEVLTLPAGGWYALDVQAMKGEQSLGHSTVAKFGVGEVFAGAGQSNSTNSGQFRTKQTSGMVASFGGEHWQLADDPQPGVADKTEGGSFWPAFGDALYAKYKVPIGVATTGYGGTSVNAWQPDTGLFDWTMTRIRQLGPGGFRALLWHQGESDVDMTSDEYYTKLKTVIAATKQEAGWGFPWFIAQASYHSQDQPSFASVRTAQAQLWADGIAFRGPDTDTLTGDHRDSDGLGIHFSPKGLKAHGEMWAQIVAEYVDQQLDE